MKILHYINNLGTGGAEKLLTDILPYMSRKGHKVDLMVCNNIRSFQKNIDVIEASNIRILNLNSSFYNPVQIFKIVRIINSEKYDIVHAHLFPTQYWLGLATFFTRSGTKFIKTEHSLHNERKDYKVLQPLEKLIYGRYHHIIGITDEVTLNITNWINRKNNISTILNGVNLEEIFKSHENIDLDSYGFISPTNYNILMVARFDGIHKDQQTLIKAVSRLGENVHLFFVGEGPSEENIKQFVDYHKLSDRVHFLGTRSDVYALMHLVDLNVLSTRLEGLSGVALESLASGRPFLGSDVPGVREVVPSEQFLFPSGDFETLAQKIEDLSVDPTRAGLYARLAKQHIRKYDTSIMAESYLQLYQEELL